MGKLRTNMRMRNNATFLRKTKLVTLKNENYLRFKIEKKVIEG